MAPMSVYVRGLGEDTQKEDLEREFGRFGNLTKVWVACNPPGFAFIEFEKDDDANEAVKEMNGAMINGAEIIVDASRGGRRRGDGGFRGGRDHSFDSGFRRGGGGGRGGGGRGFSCGGLGYGGGGGYDGGSGYHSRSPIRHRFYQCMAPMSVYVRGLGEDTQKEDLEREFGRFGNLTKVWVACNPPGFAFIEFENDNDANEAIKEMNGAMINGAEIIVDASRGRRGRGDGGFRGGRGGHGGGGFRGGHDRSLDSVFRRGGGRGGGDRGFSQIGSGYCSRSPIGERSFNLQKDNQLESIAREDALNIGTALCDPGDIVPVKEYPLSSAEYECYLRITEGSSSLKLRSNNHQRNN